MSTPYTSPAMTRGVTNDYAGDADVWIAEVETYITNRWPLGPRMIELGHKIADRLIQTHNPSDYDRRHQIFDLIGRRPIPGVTGAVWLDEPRSTTAYGE